MEHQPGAALAINQRAGLMHTQRGQLHTLYIQIGLSPQSMDDNTTVQAKMNTPHTISTAANIIFPFVVN